MILNPASLLTDAAVIGPLPALNPDADALWYETPSTVKASNGFVVS